MAVLFFLIAIGLCGWAVVDEVARGSILNPDHDREDGELIEFPLPDGWTEKDVLTTYAEISAL